MKQSRFMSVVEAFGNVAIGYVLAVITQIVVFPVWGIQASLGENLNLGLIFTCVSIARSYALRRLFEEIGTRWNDKKGVVPKHDPSLGRKRP